MSTESALLSMVLCASGIALVCIGIRRRSRLTGDAEGKQSEVEHPESLILLGGLRVGMASLLGLRGSPFAPVGLVLVGVAYGVWGVARIRTRNGRATLLLGLLVVLLGGAFYLI